MDDEATTRVHTPGVDADAPNITNKSDKAKIKPTNVESMSSTMNLHRQPRKEYNLKNNNNVFNVTAETQTYDIILIQLRYEEGTGTFDVTEVEFDEVEAKYMLLTETLGWKEGIDGMRDTTSDADPNDVTKLAKYVVLTEQMG